VKHTDTLFYRKEMVCLLTKQEGLSLIELLVTLAILSFIGIIIWSVFIQGYKFSQKSISKNTMQQETNLLITNLKKIHQTSKEYNIITGTCTITVNATKSDDSTQTYVFDHPNLCFSLDRTGLIQPDIEDVKLTITISEKNDSENKLEIETILYRLKDGGI
jgi:prepilin-type N-terminal cleavage/methylation domain-containing protein